MYVWCYIGVSLLSFGTAPWHVSELFLVAFFFTLGYILVLSFLIPNEY